MENTSGIGKYSGIRKYSGIGKYSSIRKYFGIGKYCRSGKAVLVNIVIILRILWAILADLLSNATEEASITPQFWGIEKSGVGKYSSIRKYSGVEKYLGIIKYFWY